MSQQPSPVKDRRAERAYNTLKLFVKKGEAVYQGIPLPGGASPPTSSLPWHAVLAELVGPDGLPFTNPSDDDDASGSILAELSDGFSPTALDPVGLLSLAIERLQHTYAPLTLAVLHHVVLPAVIREYGSSADVPVPAPHVQLPTGTTLDPGVHAFLDSLTTASVHLLAGSLQTTGPWMQADMDADELLRSLQEFWVELVGPLCSWDALPSKATRLLCNLHQDVETQRAIALTTALTNIYAALRSSLYEQKLKAAAPVVPEPKCE
jgi:hypothetical protein